MKFKIMTIRMYLHLGEDVRICRMHIHICKDIYICKILEVKLCA